MYLFDCFLIRKACVYIYWSYTSYYTLKGWMNLAIKYRHRPCINPFICSFFIHPNKSDTFTIALDCFMISSLITCRFILI